MLAIEQSTHEYNHNNIYKVKKCHYSSIVDGFSMSDLKVTSHCAPTAPSTTLWSQLRVTVIMLAMLYLGRSRRGGEEREEGGGRDNCQCMPHSNLQQS